MLNTPRSLATLSSSGRTSATRATSTAMYMPMPSPLMAMPTRKPLNVLATAMVNIARPYTIDEAQTKIFRRPVGSESLPLMREAADQEGGLGEGAEEDLSWHIALGAADLVQQVVGLVGGRKGVGQDEQGAAGERPGEVRALPRADVERAGEFCSDQVGTSARPRRRSFSVAANSRMKNPPIAHGARNMTSWLPVNSA